MRHRKHWTNDEDKFLQDNYSDYSNQELARKLGRSYLAIRMRTQVLGLSKEKVQYAVYKGDVLLVMGTVKECAEALNVTEKYIRWLTSPAAKKRIKRRKKQKNVTTAVRV